jgi:23S rRNA G2069 N7-methylase RlmK/C1962 C5-methylase RlmI
MGATVTLKPNRDGPVRCGAPLVLDSAVASSKGALPGEIVTLQDSKGEAIGRGAFNPHSQYRFRLLVTATEAAYAYSLPALLALRVQQAVSLRRACSLPSAETTVYRLINGEGDRLSGLFVDVIGGVVVAQSCALWTEVHKQSITDALQTGTGKCVVWLQNAFRLAADGWGGRGGGAQEAAATPHTEESEVVVENGVRYAIHPGAGQKTGFYCDQRENRLLVRSLAQGRAVLDTFCYHGGFALNAAVGGATRVVAVDSSKEALAVAEGNVTLNAERTEGYKGMEKGVELVQGEALVVMERLYREGQTFDLVVCDPPKLAPTHSSLGRAEGMYIKINAAALRLVAPGGLLLTCSCSAAVTEGGVLPSLLAKAAARVGRHVSVLSTTHEGKDHPIHGQGEHSTRYLTAVLAVVLDEAKGADRDRPHTPAR